MIKHIKNELRIFIHRFKRRHNGKREQKLIHRANMIKESTRHEENLKPKYKSFLNTFLFNCLLA